MFKLEPPRVAQNRIVYLNLLQDNATFISRESGVARSYTSSPSWEKNSKNVRADGVQRAALVKKLTANDAERKRLITQLRFAGD